MMIIDTDIASGFLKQRVDPRLQAWVARNNAAEFAFAAPTIAEIRYGCALLPQADPRAARLDTWLRDVRAIATILPLDARAADFLGLLWATPALKNFILAQPNQRQIKTGADLMVAAIALGFDATVVTANFAGFEMIARYFPTLGVEDPLTGRRVPE